MTDSEFRVRVDMKTEEEVARLDVGRIERQIHRYTTHEWRNEK